MITLLSEQTADTDGSQDYETFSPLVSGVNSMVLFVEGTFDGATAGLEIKHPTGGDWIADSDLAFTSAAVKKISLPSGSLVRGYVSSAGASTSLTVRMA